jgi:hypothetical protein
MTFALSQPKILIIAGALSLFAGWWLAIARGWNQHPVQTSAPHGNVTSIESKGVLENPPVDVKVNGQSVPIKLEGITHVTPDGKTTVTVSGNSTRQVQTSTPSGSTSIHVESSSTTNGGSSNRSSSTTTIRSDSSTHTRVSGNGSTKVNVQTHP